MRRASAARVKKREDGTGDAERWSCAKRVACTCRPCIVYPSNGNFLSSSLHINVPIHCLILCYLSSSVRHGQLNYVQLSTQGKRTEYRNEEVSSSSTIIYVKNNLFLKRAHQFVTWRASLTERIVCKTRPTTLTAKQLISVCVRSLTTDAFTSHTTIPTHTTVGAMLSWSESILVPNFKIETRQENGIKATKSHRK